MRNSITINTDGSCHGNPGPGGYAAIIEIPNHGPITVRGGEADTTNNRMEMLAVINGLKELTGLADVSGVPITIRTDSEYVANAFNKGWLDNWQGNGWKTSGRKPVKNQELWQEMLKAAGGLELSFVHVRGHAGDPGNEACDRIANEEAERAGRTGTGPGNGFRRGGLAGRASKGRKRRKRRANRTGPEGRRTRSSQ